VNDFFRRYPIATLGCGFVLGFMCSQAMRGNSR
jgi:hypothetical protein